MNSLERGGECMDPSEYRMEICPGLETAHQVEQFHIQQGLQQQGGGGLGRVLGWVRAQGVSQMQRLIIKMDDGSCSHMTCAVQSWFRVMKKISHLDYLLPSG